MSELRETRLTPHGVLQKHAEDEGLAWSSGHASAAIDRLRHEGYQIVDGPKAGAMPYDRVPPEQLNHGQRIVVGLHDQWLADVIGTHETADEVMIVMVVPKEAVFEVAGTTPKKQIGTFGGVPVVEVPEGMERYPGPERMR